MENVTSRDSFIFYRSFFEAISELDNETRLVIYDAITEFSLNFKEPSLMGVAKAMFTLIKPQLEANNKRYENGIKPKQKQEISKVEAKQKQEISKVEANKNKNKNKNKNNNNNVVSLLLPKSFNGFSYPSKFLSLWNLYKEGSKSEAYKAYVKIAQIKNDEICLKDEFINPLKIIIESENKKTQYKRHLSTILNLDIKAESEKVIPIKNNSNLDGLLFVGNIYG